MPRIRLTGMVLCLALPFFLVSLGNCTQLSAEEKKAQHYERGMAYFHDEKYQEALIEFKNIIQLDPSDAKAYHQLALIHLKLGGLPNLQAAFGELTKAVEIDPTIEDAHLKLGDFYLLSQKPLDAKKHAEIVLASSPQDPKGHLLRGRSLIIEKEFEEGIAELKKSIELDPENEHIYIDLARAYLAMKKPEEAEATLRKALENKKDSTTLILAMGDLLLIQGKRSEAEEQYQRALDIDSNNEALYAKLGQYYLGTQQWKKAEEVYQQLANRQPQLETPQMLLGEYYTYMGSGSKALEHFQKAVELKPQSEPARQALINFHLDNQQWDEAEKLIQSSKENSKKNIVQQVFQGRLLLGRGKPDEAIPLFQKVLKEEPQQAMAHQYLGLAFASQNDIPRAIQELSQAAKLAPQDRAVRKALAATRLAEGSFV
ncbi:MAG: tetratricopeptide repeat protein, partial [Nitrospirota bacterium]|nr:tetratricopeptide repeat protein [Nitrospirota bacterium]